MALRGAPTGRLRVQAGDVVGGVSAAFVLMPQALAYAVLAGLPAERGLLVAAVAPIVAALFASSPYLATGPTAITALLTLGALSALADPGSGDYVSHAALLALLVGAARVALGFARLGAFSYLISQPVLMGFTTGAAVVITASQVPSLVDVSTDERNPFRAAADALADPGAWRPSAVAIALVVGAVIGLGRRAHRLFPGVLVASVGALAWSAVASYDGTTVGEIAGRLPTIDLGLPWGSVGALLIPAAVIAVIGFSEPAAIARHYATLDRVRWDPDRELVSQGMANVAAGLVGGFPAGGSFTRSALVREAGARTRLAGAITGLVVLLLLPFSQLLEPLPTAALAASIVMAVRGFLTVRPFLELRRYTRLQHRLAVATFAATIVTAPRVERAIVAGIAIAIAAHLWRELRISVDAWQDGSTLHLAPKGVLYFASAPQLDQRLSDLLSGSPDADSLVVHLSGLGRIDVTGAIALRDLLAQAGAAGLSTTVADVPPQSAKIVARVIGRSPPR